MNKRIIALDDSNLKKELSNKHDFFLVDFWASWCNPCQILSTILEEISREFEELVIAKIDIEKNPIAVSKYDIRSVPTLIFFRKGEMIDTKVGLLSKEQMKDFLMRHMK